MSLPLLLFLDKMPPVEKLEPGQTHLGLTGSVFVPGCLSTLESVPTNKDAGFAPVLSHYFTRPSMLLLRISPYQGGSSATGYEIGSVTI